MNFSSAGHPTKAPLRPVRASVNVSANMNRSRPGGPTGKSPPKSQGLPGHRPEKPPQHLPMRANAQPGRSNPLVPNPSVLWSMPESQLSPRQCNQLATEESSLRARQTRLQGFFSTWQCLQPDGSPKTYLGPDLVKRLVTVYNHKTKTLPELWPTFPQAQMWTPRDEEMNSTRAHWTIQPHYLSKFRQQKSPSICLHTYSRL